MTYTNEIKELVEKNKRYDLDTKPMFEYSKLKDDETLKEMYFLRTNWNDPTFDDFIDLLETVSFEEKIINGIKIKHSWENDENTWEVGDDYVIERYKRRGNIETFLDKRTNKQINLYDFYRLYKKLLNK